MLQVRDMSIDETAAFLGVTPATVRSRLRSKELRSVQSAQGPQLVRFAPLEDTIRLPDAAGILGIATSTVRAACARGELAGQRVNGRWRVRLVSVLEDPRADPAVVELFGGSPTPRPPVEPPRRPPATAYRQVQLRLPLEDAERLERLQAARGGGHGSLTLVILDALRALDESPDAPSSGELAELRSELAARGEQLERARAAHRGLHERAQGRLVDELYCPVCERLVAVEEFEPVGVAGDVELVHQGHPHRHRSRLRPGTVAARRQRLGEEPVAEG